MHRKPTISHSSPLQIFQRAAAQYVWGRNQRIEQQTADAFQAVFHPNLPPLFWRQEKTVAITKSTQGWF